MRRVLAPVVVLVLALTAWWAIARMLGLSSFLLPTPQDVAVAMGKRSSYLFDQTVVTLWQTAVGFALAGVAALGCAILVAASTLLREALMPLLVAIQAVPKVAVAPLLGIWLGFGASPKVMLVVLLCFFPILIAALAGLTSTPAEIVEFGRSLSASRWSMFTRIRIPWALPQTFTGLKVAISLALIGAVVAQLAHPNSGLGMVIVRANQGANTALAFAAIVLLGVVGIALFYAVVGAEKLLVPWAKHTSG